MEAAPEITHEDDLGMDKSHKISKERNCKMRWGKD
jgi:hypothetical protein